VANGVVYVGSGYGDNNVYALDAATGTLLWSYATGGPVRSSPAVANGVVYIGSGDQSLYAFHVQGQ
jgi:outer membrane protein assembly factor BamB